MTRNDILERKEDILQWISENQSKAFICRQLKCKPETLNSYLAKMGIDYKGNKGLKISLNNRLREQFREQLKELNMGLENRLNDNVDQFSGGQRQALTLLMAVMSKPDLLLLDEHTAALDPANADLVMQLTLKFTREMGLTTMMVTHNMQHALDYGNRLIMMHKGQIILDINGEQKKNLTMEDLIAQFKKIQVSNDALMLQ